MHMPVAVEDGVEEARTRVSVACGGQHGGGFYGSARASPRLRQRWASYPLGTIPPPKQVQTRAGRQLEWF